MKPVEQVGDTIDRLFRLRSGQMVAVLTHRFGVANIELIEDAVQDSMVAALRTWPYNGVPENQLGWLILTARNKYIDHLRRASRNVDGVGLALPAPDLEEPRFAGELNEDQLRLIFACCHPSIPADSRVALTLKIVGGFSVSEIARAYLAKADAVAKMLTRARARLRVVRLEVPAGTELGERLGAVLRVLYLMFNEGYSAAEGDELIRRDLCFESIRLADLLIGHPVTSLPKVFALAALFRFQAGRLGARADDHGDLLLLADQDRSLWDKKMIAEGLRNFRRSAVGDELSQYHVEAEIASLHSLAPDYASTDWSRMLAAYDSLLGFGFSPVVALNRAVAIGQVRGPDAALEEIASLGSLYMMTSFNHYHAVLGHFLAEKGEHSLAADAFRRAIELTRNEPIRRYLHRRIAGAAARLNGTIHQ